MQIELNAPQFAQNRIGIIHRGDPGSNSTVPKSRLPSGHPDPIAMTDEGTRKKIRRLHVQNAPSPIVDTDGGLSTMKILSLPQPLKHRSAIHRTEAGTDSDLK
jgi:hypothetical protein